MFLAVLIFWLGFTALLTVGTLCLARLLLGLLFRWASPEPRLPDQP